MRYSNDARRELIAAYAKPAPRSPNSNYIELLLGFYAGHTVYAPADRRREKHEVIHCTSKDAFLKEMGLLWDLFHTPTRSAA